MLFIKRNFECLDYLVSLNVEKFFKHDDSDVFHLEVEKKKSIYKDLQKVETEIFDWIPEK